MTRQKRLVPIIVGVVLLGALTYSLLPFDAAGGVDCKSALLGAKPKNERGPGLTNPKENCRDEGKSRLTVAAVTALIATVAGAAALALKPVSKQCHNGDHADCHDTWQSMLGGFGASLACQCECHGAAP